jgi:hypothetical protein
MISTGEGSLGTITTGDTIGCWKGIVVGWIRVMIVGIELVCPDGLERDGEVVGGLDIGTMGLLKTGEEDGCDGLLGTGVFGTR